MSDLPSPHPLAAVGPSQRAQALLRKRLYGMKHVCCCYPPAAAAPIETVDSTSMETKPLRMRQAR